MLKPRLFFLHRFHFSEKNKIKYNHKWGYFSIPSFQTSLNGFRNYFLKL